MGCGEEWLEGLFVVFVIWAPIEPSFGVVSIEEEY